MSITINGVPFGDQQYPNKETIFKISDLNNLQGRDIIIDFKYENDSDIFKLVILKKYLNEQYPLKYKILSMPYIPYSRMDRLIPGYLFSLRYFCGIINALEFDAVWVLDPHSPMSTNFLSSVIQLDVSYYIHQAINKMVGLDYIFYPDKGAMARYSKVIRAWIPYFYGSKERDLDTGKIIKFKLIGCPDIKGKNILIVDDLCSYGGTFIASANLLKGEGAASINLYVSHCEDSIFEGQILETNLIDRVYTTTSILTKTHEKITILT